MKCKRVLFKMGIKSVFTELVLNIKFCEKKLCFLTLSNNKVQVLTDESREF